MIQLEHITLRRGVEDLLVDASLTVHAGQKIGLVGPNGCGKSSLFALLLGELEPDTGEVRIPEEWTVAHMAQQISELERPALEFVLDGDRALRRAEKAMAEADASGDGERIAHAHQQFDDARGFDARLCSSTTTTAAQRWAARGTRGRNASVARSSSTTTAA